MKDKLTILKVIEDGKKPKEICQKYKNHKLTIIRMKYNKGNLGEFSSKTYGSQKHIKRMKPIKNSEVDKNVYS